MITNKKKTEAATFSCTVKEIYGWEYRTLLINGFHINLHTNLLKYSNSDSVKK